MIASEPVVVLVDDRLQPVLAAAAHSWEELHLGTWRFDLDGEHHHEAVAWPGEFDRVLADLRKRKAKRIIAFVTADAFAPALRKDAIGLATLAERLELREDRLEVTGKRPLPAAKSSRPPAAEGAWKRSSRVTDVRALSLPGNEAKLIEQLEGAPWVALSAEFGRLAFDFAEVLVAVIPSDPAIEDGSAIELLGEWLRFEPVEPTPAVEPAKPAAKPEPAKSADPVGAKPAEPDAPTEDPAEQKKGPWAKIVKGAGGVIVVGILAGVAWSATRPDDPCLARSFEVSESKVSISENPNPACKSPEPMHIEVRDKDKRPITEEARVVVQGSRSGDDGTPLNRTGYAEVALEELPVGELGITVWVQGRYRDVIQRESGENPQQVILTVADACDFALLDSGDQPLTNVQIQDLALSWPGGGKLSPVFEQPEARWVPKTCPALTDTPTISGFQDGRFCSGPASAADLLTTGTLRWCGATCTVRIEGASGQSVLGIKEVQLQPKDGSARIPLVDHKEGNWKFPCDADGFAGKFAPEKITYLTDVKGDLECDEDKWERTCKLPSAADAGSDAGSDAGGSHSPPPSSRECTEDQITRICDAADGKGLNVSTRVTLAVTNGKLQQPSDWKDDFSGVRIAGKTCISQDVRCDRR